MGFAEFARRPAITPWSASPPAPRPGKGLADVRLAYFGVGDTPLRARKAEAALAGGSVDDAVRRSPTDLVPQAIAGAAATKLHLAGVLIRRVADSSWRRGRERHFAAPSR